MADNVVGSRPSASGQNLYNSTRWTLDVSASFFVRGKLPLEPWRTFSHTQYFSTQSKNVGDYTSLTNVILERASLSSALANSRTWIYDDADDIIAQIGDDLTTLVNAPGILRSSASDSINMYLPPGDYKWVSFAEWDNLFDDGKSHFKLRVKQGQTDIPEDALVKRWNSDFSDYMAPQPSEDGFPISWSQDGRTGWEA